jgi:hydroxyethylthiazole kinase-like uncharacterized protein yjeF
MILSCHQMRSLEEAAFADGIHAEDLMEEAGAGIAQAVSQFHPRPGICRVYFGKGHNGGDALVAARHLAAAGWQIELFPAFPADAWSPLTTRKFQQLPPSKSLATGPLIILDGLLGTGATGPLRAPIQTATRQIRHSRQKEGARVFALDIPSGLDADSGSSDPDSVCADVTITIGFAKKGLLVECATPVVGRLCVVPLRALSERAPRLSTVLGLSTAPDLLGTPFQLRACWPPRPFDLHKGNCGRVGIVAGSKGFTGAAVLAANACVHAGAGLVTLFVPAEIEARIASTVTPEVMVRSVDFLPGISGHRFDVLAIGPGMGRSRDADVLALIRDCPQPMVVDADALNALATSPDILHSTQGQRLLTPHPGEMRRLDPGFGESSRRTTLQRFTDTFRHVLLLKGSRTLVGQQGHPIFQNLTGNPGMASGGMGDVLTGVCAALAGQGASLFDSACLGAWLCGRAAEIAVASGLHSEESLSASAVIQNLGPAFHALRCGSF